MNEEEIRTEAKNWLNHTVDFVHDHPKTMLIIFVVAVLSAIVFL